jgi:hypothetical protein
MPLLSTHRSFNMPKFSEFFTGKKGKFKQQSLLGKEQQPLYQQLLASSMGPGAGGSFGTSADYYRDLLSNDSADFNAMAAPEMRRFNEQIIPDLAEQFAGMGSGNLSSSGFRNAAVNAGTDLSERLGAIRAQLRQQGAEGLMSLGQQGLQRFNENIYKPGTGGFIDTAGPLIGTGLGALFGGPAGAAIGGSLGSGFGNMFSNKGKSSPYGDMAVNNAKMSGYGGMF